MGATESANHAMNTTFLAESQDLLEELERGLVELGSASDPREVCDAVFRAAHTLKGGARMMRLELLATVTHRLETVLDRIRSGAVAPTGEVVKPLLDTVDALRTMLEDFAEERESVPTPELESLIAELVELAPPLVGAGAAAAAKVRRPRTLRLSVRFAPQILASGDPLSLLEELESLGQLRELIVDRSKLPSLADLAPGAFHLAFRLLLATEASDDELRAVFIFVADETTLDIEDVSREHSPVDLSAADKKLGDLLVEAGAVDRKLVDGIAASQRRLGELLVEQAGVAPAAVDRALQRQRQARKALNSSSVRVETGRLDRVVNLVSELTIAMSFLGSRLADASARPDDRSAAMETVERVGRVLQEEVLALRMVPIRETFERFRRVVHDTGREAGRFVVLELEGQDTEIDRTEVEQLADPLKHLVRNAIAHGIEAPAERLAAGKSDTGRLVLRAAQREGNIVVEVVDDGRGIDLERVRAKALSKGLIDGVRPLDRRETLELLFAPGFSTAEQVDELSGRGVGLDVVRRNIEALHGSVEIESTLGAGTCFRLKLPLTLAIVDAMRVRVGQETMSVPLRSVVELVEPGPSVCRTIQGRGEVVDVRGEVLPMVRLGQLLSIAPTTDRLDPKVLIVDGAGRRCGLLVDGVIGMHQAVVKSLDRCFRVVEQLSGSYARPPGVSGATILPDGAVGMILDVDGVVRMAFDAA